MGQTQEIGGFMKQYYCPFQHQCKDYDDGQHFGLLGKKVDDILRQHAPCFYWNSMLAICERGAETEKKLNVDLT